MHIDLILKRLYKEQKKLEDEISLVGDIDQLEMAKMKKITDLFMSVIKLAEKVSISRKVSTSSSPDIRDKYSLSIEEAATTLSIVSARMLCLYKNIFVNRDFGSYARFNEMYSKISDLETVIKSLELKVECDVDIERYSESRDEMNKMHLNLMLNVLPDLNQGHAVCSSIEGNLTDCDLQVLLRKIEDAFESMQAIIQDKYAEGVLDDDSGESILGVDRDVLLRAFLRYWRSLGDNKFYDLEYTGVLRGLAFKLLSSNLSSENLVRDKLLWLDGAIRTFVKRRKREHLVATPSVFSKHHLEGEQQSFLIVLEDLIYLLKRNPITGSSVEDEANRKFYFQILHNLCDLHEKLQAMMLLDDHINEVKKVIRSFCHECSMMYNDVDHKDHRTGIMLNMVIQVEKEYLDNLNPCLNRHAACYSVEISGEGASDWDNREQALSLDLFRLKEELVKSTQHFIACCSRPRLRRHDGISKARGDATERIMALSDCYNPILVPSMLGGILYLNPFITVFQDLSSDGMDLFRSYQDMLNKCIQFVETQGKYFKLMEEQRDHGYSLNPSQLASCLRPASCHHNAPLFHIEARLAEVCSKIADRRDKSNLIVLQDAIDKLMDIRSHMCRIRI